jgi:beta-barrel assembly-enhancing protease
MNRLHGNTATALALALITLTGCATTGPHGEQSLILIDTPTEVQMGVETDRGIRQEFPVHNDAALAAYVAEVGARVSAQSERQDVTYSFTVLKSDIVNAFAAPGGYVYVTTGLLLAAHDESELAGVLAHEVGHVIGRHSVRQIQQTMGMQMAAELVLGDRGNSAWQQVAGLGAGLFTMKNSRDHEFQSDQFGVKYLVAAGYDPEGIVRFFQTLVEMNGEGASGAAGWFSTHPATEERIARARTEIALYDLSGSPRNRFQDRFRQATARLRG